MDLRKSSSLVIIGLPTYSENPVDISASADMTAFGVSVAEYFNFIITYEDVTSGSCPWTVTRTFTATDDCGNIGTATQVFTIDDTTAPVITASGPQTIEACSVIIGLPTYSENPVDISASADMTAFGVSVAEDCNFIITYEDVTSGSCPLTVTRTFTATDDCGNIGTATQVFTIDDTTAPVITASGPQTIEACSVIIGLPTYSENPVDISASADMTAFGVSVAEDCNFIITYEDVTSGSCPRTVTRTFTATDDCGNIGTATQAFTIDDTTAPVITASGPQTIEACSVIIGLPTYSENPVDISASADMTAFGVSVAEDCNFIITYEDVTSGSCPRTVTRTFTATDDCGNIGTATQVFTIYDTIAPAITASGPQTIEACCIIGLPTYSENPVDISASADMTAFGVSVAEDCNFIITYEDVTSGSCPWTVTRTFTATDDCGNIGMEPRYLLSTIRLRR